MAFHGDLLSYPLPELLQWLDSSRKTGTLAVQWEAGQRKLFLAKGQVAATSADSLWERLARALERGGVASGQQVVLAFRAQRESGDAEAAFRDAGIDLAAPVELAREELYGAVAELTQVQTGEFHWTEDDDRATDEWVPVDLGMRHVLFEALRWVDEQADVDRALPLDSMVVRALDSPTADAPLLTRIVLLQCAPPGQSLTRLRLGCGLSRPVLQRRVYELLRQHKVEVDGAPPELAADPVAEMLEKGAQLVREGQFEAAALVFAAMLSSDPGDRRVREFARMVEREHIASLYAELPPIFVPRLLDDPGTLARLRPDERHVASLVNGNWDVSTIVLASHHRELETLKCLSKLARLGLLEKSG